MKTVLYSIVTLVIFSCSPTATEKWDAATASKTCFDAATKSKYDLADNQIKKITKICDCVGEKMVTQFKSEKEANEKMTDAGAMANECIDWWKNNPENQ